MTLVAVLGWVLWTMGAPWWVWVLFALCVVDEIAGIVIRRRGD